MWLAAGSVFAATAFADVPDFIFAEPFEVVVADAFRVNSLYLRDPHIFVDFSIFGSCRDITDTPHTPFPGTTVDAINTQINAAISADADGDELFDLSSVLLFRPLDQFGAVRRLDVLSGDCLADPSTPACVPSPGAIPSISNYASSLSSTCLAPLAGSLRPYTPEVPTIAGFCYTTTASDQLVDFGDFALPLRATRSGGEWDGTDSVSRGLLRGFLSETDADLVLLPPDLPLIGGQPISSLLPGGSGNCAAHSDMDSFNGEPGWWVYLEFSAASVPFAP